LKSDKPSTDDYFGLNVAVSGDTLAVSSTRASPYGDISSRRRGLVYVYTRTAGTWTRQATLSAPDGDGPDLFGYGLALQHDRLVVGAPFDSQSAAHGGAVYVFTRSGGSWSAPTKLVAMTPQAEDYLGCSVALDADTLLAGAHHENQAVVGQSGAGSARVFVRRDNTWVEQQRLQAPSPGDGDMFGFSVALLGDTAIVGAPHGDLFAMVPSGRAYVFERSGDKWMTTTTLEAPVPRDADYFGGAVALSQSAAVVGANGDASGASGTKADAARDDAPQSGAFYVYTRNEETWIRSAFVKPTVVDRDDRFARRVALDGDTVVVSTIDEGSNASGIDGDATNDGAKWSGAAYVFR
jgi:hypothetical protein